MTNTNETKTFEERQNAFIDAMLKLKEDGDSYVAKTGNNNMHGSSSFMTTDSVMHWVNNIPPKYGLFVRYIIEAESNACTKIIMRVTHKDGYSEDADFLVREQQGKNANNTAQSYASYFTYLKRQLASAYFCLNDCKDDDGNLATANDIKNRCISAISDSFSDDMKQWPDQLRTFYYENIHAQTDIKSLLNEESVLMVELQKMQ